MNEQAEAAAAPTPASWLALTRTVLRGDGARVEAWSATNDAGPPATTTSPLYSNSSQFEAARPRSSSPAGRSAVVPIVRSNTYRRKARTLRELLKLRPTSTTCSDLHRTSTDPMRCFHDIGDVN
jgi:hypothetical protein